MGFQYVRQFPGKNLNSYITLYNKSINKHLLIGTEAYPLERILLFIVLQQSSKKWASFRDGGPHRVTSSNMHQIKAKSLPN